LDQRGTGIDEHAHFGDMIGNAPGQRARLVEVQVARARREEDEAHMAGATGDGGVERFRRRKATDFGGDGHGGHIGPPARFGKLQPEARASNAVREASMRSRFFAAHTHTPQNASARLSPSSVRRYSTLGGMTGWTVRISSPSRSIARTVWVSIFWLM